MEGEKITVTAYAGYRGEEAPRAFTLHGEQVTVLAVIATWLAEDAETRERRRYFRVRGSDGLLHDICCVETTMEWFHLESAPWPPVDAGTEGDESAG